MFFSYLLFKYKSIVIFDKHRSLPLVQEEEEMFQHYKNLGPQNLP